LKFALRIATRMSISVVLVYRLSAIYPPTQSSVTKRQRSLNLISHVRGSANPLGWYKTISGFIDKRAPHVWRQCCDASGFRAGFLRHDISSRRWCFNPLLSCVARAFPSALFTQCLGGRFVADGCLNRLPSVGRGHMMAGAFASYLVNTPRVASAHSVSANVKPSSRPRTTLRQCRYSAFLSRDTGQCLIASLESNGSQPRAMSRDLEQPTLTCVSGLSSSE
jgi:hypothetical protein